MKRLVFLVVMVLAAANGFAQHKITSDMVDEFSEVSFSGNVKVELIKAEKNYMDIELINVADISKFKWTQNNGAINLTLRPSSGEAVVKLYYSKPLTFINISAGQLTAPQTMESDVIRITAGSGAKLKLDIRALDLELDASGNSAMVLTGSAKYLTVRAGEKSKINAVELDAVAINADASMGAEVHVKVDERLEANAKTGATIFYKGNPTIFKDKSSKMSTGVMGSSVLNIGRTL